MLLPRRLLIGAAGAISLARATPAGAETGMLLQGAHRLTILHINDFHSRHLPVDDRALTCALGKPTCFGGSPRLATAINEQRMLAEGSGRHVLVLDGGDQFQGSLFYTAHHGAAELAVQHAIGIEAMAVGNHEFDNGPANLARYIDAARFPVLSANIDASAEPALAGRIKPWAILQKGRLRIGIIAATTLETQVTSSPGPNVRFTEPRAALTKAALAVRAQGAQFVIALSHLGLAMDRTLDIPGVDLIVGGHSHSLLSNDEPGAAGPYPTISPGGTPIVQAQAYGRYLGRLNLDLEPSGAPSVYAGECHHIGTQDPDPAVAAIVAAFAAPLEELRNRPVTTLPEPLDAAACRVAQCRLGQIVADALRAHTQGAAIGLMNAGGLRTGLPAGPITLGQVLDMMPFGNTLATLTLTGADLDAAVRHGLSMAGRGGFAQWSGLRLQALPPAIEVQQADGAWSVLDPARRYLVATNNFLRLGGDGYTMLRDRAEDAYDSGPNVADLVAESLASALR